MVKECVEDGFFAIVLLKIGEAGVYFCENGRV